MTSTLLHTTLGALALLVGTSIANGQCLDQAFEGLDTLTDDVFGESVATAGARILVGAPGDDGQASGGGSAYVFTAGANGFVQERKLESSSPVMDGAFAFDVVIADAGAMVGAPAENGFATGSGKVHTYARSGTNWIERPPLDPGEGDTDDLFGISLALDGNRVVVGAPSAHTSPSGVDGGAAYVFELGSGGWQLMSKIVPNDLIGADLFGLDVAMDGNRIVVGAGSQNNGAFFSGAAYVFDFVGGNWVQVAKLLPGAATDMALFGRSVAVEGDQVLVGEPGGPGAGGVNTGAVYFFDVMGGTWSSGTKVISAQGLIGDRYGHNVALGNGQAVIGAPLVSDGGVLDFGRVYGMAGGTGNWSLQYTLDGPGTGAGHKRFGGAVAIGAAAIAVGDSAIGQSHVYVYTTSGPDCNQNGIPDACDISAGTSADLNGDGVPDECAACTVVNRCHSSANSTGSAALMSVTGTSSVTANDLVLQAGPVPNQVGIFFYGPAGADTPLGNGTLCVSGPHQRMSPQFITGNMMTQPLDITNPNSAAGQITINSVWHFQAWFRDTTAGGSLYNLSDALKVSFCL